LNPATQPVSSKRLREEVVMRMKADGEGGTVSKAISIEETARDV
jgi:hypothetical protein